MSQLLNHKLCCTLRRTGLAKSLCRQLVAFKLCFACSTSWENTLEVMPTAINAHLVGNEFRYDFITGYQIDERDERRLDEELAAERSQPTSLHEIAHDLWYTEEGSL